MPIKCCFIGSNGFLATSLGKYFEEIDNYTINVISKTVPKDYKVDTFIKLDITEITTYEVLVDYDIIFYLIGKGIQSNSVSSVDFIYETNAFTPIKIMSFLEKANFKGIFISFGSYFEIGNNNEMLEYTELDVLHSPFKVPNDYCISKRLLSRFIYSSTFSFKYLHFILPTIYGEKENADRLIPYIIRTIKYGGKVNVTTAEQVREYIYVDEVAKILHLAIDKNILSGFYNISGSQRKTIRELILEVSSYLNYPENNIEFGRTTRTDSQMKYLLLDGTKLQNTVFYRQNSKISDYINNYWNEF